MRVGGAGAQQALGNIMMELTGGPAGDPSAGIRGSANGALDERGKIKELANEFESLFLNIVLKSMRDTVQKSKLIDGGNAEEIYSSMLDDEYAKQMAAQRHTGIADNIERFMISALDAQEEVKAEMAKAEGLSAYAKAAQTEVRAIPPTSPEPKVDATRPQSLDSAREGLTAWTLGLIRATIGGGATPLDSAPSSASPASVVSPSKVEP